MSASLDQVICWSFVGTLSVLEVSEIQIFCCMFTSFDQYHVSVIEARSLLTACEKFRAPLTANCCVLWEQLAGQCGPASVVRLAQEQPRVSILALNAFSLLLALFGEHFADPSIFPQSFNLATWWTDVDIGHFASRYWGSSCWRANRMCLEAETPNSAGNR